MFEAQPIDVPPDGSAVPSRCRVHLLPRAKPTDRGVVYRRGDEPFLLAWDRVERVFAATVGDDPKACTVVFDLAVEVTGPELVLCRITAEPGEPARCVARALVLGTAARAATDTLEAAAASGRPSWHHPDVETLELAELESIRFG